MFTRAIWRALWWTLPAALFALALVVRSPLCFKIRYLLLYLICQLTVWLAPGALRRIRAARGPGKGMARAVRAALLLAAASLAVTGEVDYQLVRWQVLATPAAQLRRAGAHLVVGYRDLDELRALVERDAVAGLFITARNVRGKTAGQVRQELAELQEIRRRRGLAPLLVTADQEGGIVSRLSPPLPPPPALSTFVAGSGDPAAVARRVEAYAEAKARGLRWLGVTANLGPVVDLGGGRTRGLDLHSAIGQRAISSDPAEVTRIAGIYSRALWRHGVRPTLKHFPGLGRVAVDTHLMPAHVDLSPEELEHADWLPFRQVSAQVPAMIMLGHVHLTRIDPTYPVSSSRRVIQGLLRQRWGFAGTLITDDFCMLPAWRGLGGIGQSALRAVQAGVDLVLISADEQQVYPVLAALLAADRQGRLPRDGGHIPAQVGLAMQKGDLQSADQLLPTDL